MDREVARTLAELESKLRELERELASLGHQAAEPEAAGERRWPVEPDASYAPISPHTSAIAQAMPAGQPSAGREAPTGAQAPPVRPVSTGSPQPQPQPPGRLVDEAVEQTVRRYSMEAQETAFGEIPATRDDQASIDLAELVRFRDRLQHTLQELIDEYSRLLSLKPRA